jgi:branched-chain amino acid transport system substrate-binding protein
MGAGCTSRSNTTASVSGKALSVYSSVPRTSLGTDLYEAEQLALGSGQVGGFTVALKRLPESSTKDITNNARAAIKDTHTIAYLGETVPGSTEDGSVEITNEAGILQVSPTDNALELTQSTPVVPGAPSTFYPDLKTFSYTFARVVPRAAVEAKAQVDEMRALGVKKLWIEDDGSHYGKAIARAVHDAVGGRSITVVGTGPTSSAGGADALFLGAKDPTAAAATLNTLPSNLKLFVPSALYDPAFATALTPTAYVSVPGALHSTFDAQFKATYHRPPAIQAIFGYMAMSALLADLRQQGSSANKLSSVINGFRSLSNQQSALGVYSIKNGEIEFASGKAPFAWVTAKAHNFHPYKSAQVG